ncbi:hypothetical protein O4J56_18490 [Nocardiopsis sp. RSe5-2]|uniref:Secreted protein n=1 Tax=Nocardiopsis endophytica TaxID=3018445 RepID=A0ABT4U6R5_9ACTN|nr:hypothetical protein [Nocardiopsis endophytica]MDA2812639.1 hypothetical protein [Nocardiopsis endophytica]
MSFKGKFASVFIGTAAALTLLTPATSAAADEASAASGDVSANAVCRGGYTKRILGEGYLKYSVCTKTNSSGTKFQMVEGRLVDTKNNNIYLRATVDYTQSTAGYFYYVGSKSGTKIFKSPWRAGNVVVSLSSHKD